MCLPPSTTTNNLEINMKVEELKKIVKKINDKNVHLEGKIKEIEEREVVKIKEAAKYIEHPRKVSNKVENSLDPKEKKSKPIEFKPKDSVFKFGAAVRKLCLIKVDLQKKNYWLNISNATSVITSVRSVLIKTNIKIQSTLSKNVKCAARILKL